MQDLIFEGTVDESEVGKIREGMLLDLNVGALDDHKFRAVLEYIAPKGTDDNGTIKFQIRAAVELPSDTFLRAGYSAARFAALREQMRVAIEGGLAGDDPPYSFQDCDVLLPR